MENYTKSIIILFAVWISNIQLSYCQNISIIPKPVELTEEKGSFRIFEKTEILYAKGAKNSATFLSAYIRRNFAIHCKSKEQKEADNEEYSIVLKLVPPIDNTPEKYKIEVSKKNIWIEGDERGIFNAVQTLIQLFPVEKMKADPKNHIDVPGLSMVDYPRFGYRGMHLDVGRHFFPVDYIKKYIDYLAMHKFNTFHWHLTEDQGWRIEIKKYPNLTTKGAWRNGTIEGRYPGTANTNVRYGGFYTKDELKEIVQYAADRYITVIPEIEMPGHSSAAIASYPNLSCFSDESTIIPGEFVSAQSKKEKGKKVQETWGVFEDVFCAGKEETFTFLQDVLDEVMEIFPSKIIHIGGDECPKENWKRCPKCQARLKAEGLKDEHELQSYFIKRIEKYLNSKGRNIIGWDEIIEGGLAPNAAVMSWRGEEGGIAAAKANHPVVMTPGGWCYFDHSQSRNEDSVTIGGFTSIEKVYGYEPIPAVLSHNEAKYILGAQANVWTEYITNPSKVEYMIFPRMSALSEVLWSPKDNRNWEDFEPRLVQQLERYQLWKANYSKAFFDLKATVIPSNEQNGIQWKLETKISDATLQYKTGNDKPQKYKNPIPITTSQTLEAFQIQDDKLIGNKLQQKFNICKSTGKPINLVHSASKNYAGDGDFTLVNGIINTKGMAKSSEYLGFSGTDCEGSIDLLQETDIKTVTAHWLKLEGSWIHAPLKMEIQVSSDNNTFSSIFSTDKANYSNSQNATFSIAVSKKARYIRFKIHNAGIIPVGKQGAGEKAWLFVNEIQVE